MVPAVVGDVDVTSDVAASVVDDGGVPVVRSVVVVGAGVMVDWEPGVAAPLLHAAAATQSTATNPSSFLWTVMERVTSWSA
jgi:hypothetical protein